MHVLPEDKSTDNEHTEYSKSFSQVESLMPKVNIQKEGRNASRKKMPLHIQLRTRQLANPRWGLFDGDIRRLRER
jgi:hypothetical protein